MTDVAIQNAVRDLLLGISPAIVPQTTVTTATQGAASLTVVDASQLTQGGLIGFKDTLGEEMLAIGSISGSTVTLNLAGTGYTGLQYTHTANTIVYTNLATEEGIAPAAMLAKGKPVLYVWVTSQDETKRGLGGLTSTSYGVRIEYHRQLDRPEDSGMNPGVWWQRQMASARADVNVIVATLKAHATLTTNATMLGKIGGAGTPYIRRRWERIRSAYDTDQLVVKIDFDVTGGFTHMTP
jgi:hypothetical protein